MYSDSFNSYYCIRGEDNDVEARRGVQDAFQFLLLYSRGVNEEVNGSSSRLSILTIVFRAGQRVRLIEVAGYLSILTIVFYTVDRELCSGEQR